MRGHNSTGDFYAPHTAEIASRLDAWDRDRVNVMHPKPPISPKMAHLKIKS